MLVNLFVACNSDCQTGHPELCTSAHACVLYESLVSIVALEALDLNGITG